MSSCSRTNSKFVVTRGIDNSYVFTIKQDSSTLPIEIAPTDTFIAHIRKLSDGTVVFSKAMVVEDALSGRVELTITSLEADSLEPSRGGEEDRYYLKPQYALILECSTDANGEFLAKVPSIYVE